MAFVSVSIGWDHHLAKSSISSSAKKSKGFRKHSHASTSWIEQGKPFFPWATQTCQHINAFNKRHERQALLWHLLYKTGQARCCDGHFLQIAFVLLIFLQPLLFSIHNCKPQKWFGQNWTPPKKRKTNRKQCLSQQTTAKPTTESNFFFKASSEISFHYFDLESCNPNGCGSQIWTKMKSVLGRLFFFEVFAPSSCEKDQNEKWIIWLNDCDKNQSMNTDSVLFFFLTLWSTRFSSSIFLWESAAFCFSSEMEVSMPSCCASCFFQLFWLFYISSFTISGTPTFALCLCFHSGCWFFSACRTCHKTQHERGTTWKPCQKNENKKQAFKRWALSGSPTVCIPFISVRIRFVIIIFTTNGLRLLCFLFLLLLFSLLLFCLRLFLRLVFWLRLLFLLSFWSSFLISSLSDEDSNALNLRRTPPQEDQLENDKPFNWEPPTKQSEQEENKSKLKNIQTKLAYCDFCCFWLCSCWLARLRGASSGGSLWFFRLFLGASFFAATWCILVCQCFCTWRYPSY